MSHTASDRTEKSQAPAFAGASVTLRGSVDKIISSPGGRGQVVQIIVEGAEPLYREIRIRNPFQDASGNVITLQSASEVEISIKVLTGV